MKEVVKTIRRYLSLLLTFAKNSLAGQLEYRINFLCGIFVETGFMLSKLTYVVLIYKTNISINGMSPDHMLIFIGTYAIMTGLYMSIYPNFCNIAGYVKEGTLDMLITKPVSLLFLVSFRYIDFAMPIPNILGGIIMVWVGWARSGLAFSWGMLLIFVGYFVLGMILTYSIYLLPRLVAFWTTSSNGIIQISDSLWDFNNMPMKIYHRVIQEIGCFLFPVFLITNMPGLILTDTIPVGFVIWSVIVPFLALGITLMTWRHAVKSYTSASS